MRRLVVAMATPSHFFTALAPVRERGEESQTLPPPLLSSLEEAVVPRKRTHGTSVRYAVSRPRSHDHGLCLQVCRLVLTKTPAEARPKEGRGREVLNPHLLRRVFCRFASRAFFSLPVCQPVLFALQAFAGSFFLLRKLVFHLCGQTHARLRCLPPSLQVTRHTCSGGGDYA